MININAGHNREIMEKCKVLEEYSIFIQRVKEYNKTTKNLTEAVNRAVDDCIEDGILRDVLEKQKKEVVDVVLTEFDEEKFEAMIREEEREEGRKEGQFLTLIGLVHDGIISLEEAARRAGMTESEFQSAIQSLKISSDK